MEISFLLIENMNKVIFAVFNKRIDTKSSRENLLESATKSAKQWRVIYQSGIVQNENEKVRRCSDWCEGGDFFTANVGQGQSSDFRQIFDIFSK